MANTGGKLGCLGTCLLWTIGLPFVALYYFIKEGTK